MAVKRDTRIAVRVAAPLREVIAREAEKDQRSLSSMIRKVLADRFEAEGRRYRVDTRERVA
jgi:predicted HicB family RNase H-like nuclease